jgi:hypothetical protein
LTAGPSFPPTSGIVLSASATREQIGSGGKIRRHMGWPARPVLGAETAEI